MNRTENLNRLVQEEFDLCIIGGGASGAGCALDAALRGLKVALIEKTDFAAETSGRSTKLVHGGVRYLEQAFLKLDFAQLRQVRHGLEERRILLQNAPHLTRPLGLVTPVFSWWEGFYISVGLKLYDWFSISRRRSDGRHGKDSLPPSRWLNKLQALELMPGLSNRIHSAVLYYDGQMDDARYCLALIQTAAATGAVVANHLEVIGFRKNDNGTLVAAILQNQVDDGPPFELKARQFLNCTGPYADHVRQMANPGLSLRIRPSKGVHLVLPREILNSDHAMLIPKTRDGRMVFAIPFEGNLLLGTTDEPYSSLDKEPLLEADEVNFLLETFQPFVSQTLVKEQVRAGFAGIRPLLQTTDTSFNRSSKKQTKSLLRDHEVERDPISGLISLLGGKWTTYRLMARDAIDAVYEAFAFSENQLSPNDPPICTTSEYKLTGSKNFEPHIWKKLRDQFGFDEDVCKHLASKYGGLAVDISNVAVTQSSLSERILPDFPFLKAEIVYAVRAEMALTIRDFMARRIRLECTDWEAARQAAPVVAKYMGSSLGWSTLEQKNMLQKYLDLLDSFIKCSKYPSST